MPSCVPYLDLLHKFASPKVQHLRVFIHPVNVPCPPAVRLLCNLFVGPILCDQFHYLDLVPPQHVVVKNSGSGHALRMIGVPRMKSTANSAACSIGERHRVQGVSDGRKLSLILQPEWNRPAVILKYKKDRRDPTNFRHTWFVLSLVSYFMSYLGRCSNKCRFLVHGDDLQP